MAREIIESDRSPRVRLAVIRHLLDSGLPVDFDLYRLAADTRAGDPSDLTTFLEERALEAETALTVPLDELRNGIQWISRSGPACYQALGLRDSEWAQRNVRRDLRTGFAALIDSERESVLASAITTAEATVARPLTDEERAAAVQKFEDVWQSWNPAEKVGQFTLRQYTRAALHVLVATGGRADARIARQFASSGDQDLRGEALRLFAAFGTSRDATTVVKLTEQIYDPALQILGAETALRLAYKKDKLAVLAALREVHALRSWTVEQLARIPGGVDEAWSLLWSLDADIRIAAASVIWDAVSPENADRLLSIYTDNRHFYNVVRAVDRRLFAPNWLADALPDSS